MDLDYEEALSTITQVDFAGHGCSDQKGQDYLLPSDVVMTSLNETAIPVSMLYDKIDKLPARKKIIFLDACRIKETRYRDLKENGHFGIPKLL